MVDFGLISLLYFVRWRADAALEEADSSGFVGLLEEKQAEELVVFLQLTLRELNSRRHASVPLLPERVRISRELRIFIGHKELKIRPMAKTILLLFLRHPEGIVLKEIGLYKKEMLGLYRRVMRSLEPEVAEHRVQRILDIFNNDLNVNISRVNAAFAAMIKDERRLFYKIQGPPGEPKKLLLDRSWVCWE